MAATDGALACLLLLTTLYWTSCLAFESFAQAKWPNHGGGIENLREARLGGKLSTSIVANLRMKWKVKTTGDVTATPAIANGIVYFPTWDGELFAVREKDGSILWRKNLTEVVVGSKTIIWARATPVVENKYLLVGIYGPALLVALHIQTGKFLWSTLLDANPHALITMSGTVYESNYYVGISSLSENVVDEPCCTFQGSMVKVDIRTGKIMWRTKMVPDNGNKIGLYSGAAIWGSSPSIDCKRRMIYIATGNLYSTPPDVTECEAKQENKTVRDVPDPCISPDDHSESILALNLDSGRVVWAHQLGGYDTWVISCITPGPQLNCPPIVGPDYDFGEAPMMLTIPHANKHGRKWLDVVIAGQKSGVVWALERDNGTIVWDTVSGPGSALGGSMWGMTTDGEQVFTNVVNYYQDNFTLLPSNVVTKSGGWVAMNASSGEILWSVANPDLSLPYGPLSSANGVVFAPAMGAPNGTMYALDPKSGGVLWRQKVAGWLQGGASISNGCIYFGEGQHPTNVSSATPSVVNAICLP